MPGPEQSARLSRATGTSCPRWVGGNPLGYVGPLMEALDVGFTIAVVLALAEKPVPAPS
jgi:hypothetical protein